MKSKTQLIRNILLLCSLVFALGNCDKSAALGPLKTEALKLVGEHSAKLGSIKGMLGPMMGKLDAIPDTIPGASALKATLTEKMTSMTSLSTMLDGAGGKVEELVKSGDKAGLTSLLGEIKGAGDTLTDLESFGTDSTAQLAELEKLAAANADGGAALDYTHKLSTGYEIKGSSTGVESMLVTFMDDKEMAVEKTKWFNFDRLTFATGSSNLDMGKSKDQLTNMSEILKAYGDMTVTLGGYTDNTGNAAKNVALSQKRADSVRAALVDMGVDVSRVATKGYGAEHPVCPANDTPACKKQNRRIAVNVTKK